MRTISDLRRQSVPATASQTAPRPSVPGPGPDDTLSERFVARASALLGGRPSRRSFLVKTAVVGSALAVNPFDFILKPGTAYGYLCGTCSDGWTAFCCTINGGRNSCPPGSFVAGWWKADNAAYCCGAARYIIDCNASCPTSCSCRCSGASCDGRRTCCNQFRYGQCHQEIRCYGPVVCRVATCTPPWRYDPSCTTSSATDNRTVNHGAPCLPGCAPPPSEIDKKYASLGGSGGFLGPVVQAERAITGTDGRYAIYRYGRIYWRPATGAWEVHGSILDVHQLHRGIWGPLGYPTSDVLSHPDGRSRYSRFEAGRIYRWARGTFAVHGAICLRHEANGGVTGALGYPTSNTLTSSEGRSQYVNFERGRIYLYDRGNFEIHGSIFTRHEGLGGVHGRYGYPTSDTRSTDRSFYSNFERGRIYALSGTWVAGVEGSVYMKHESLGGVHGLLGYPLVDTADVGDQRGRFGRFERGNVYSSNVGTCEVHGPILAAYLNRGGPRGLLGYPVTDTYSDGTLRRQRYERGRLTYDPATGLVTQD